MLLFSSLISTRSLSNSSRNRLSTVNRHGKGTPNRRPKGTSLVVWIGAARWPGAVGGGVTGSADIVACPMLMMLA